MAGKFAYDYYEIELPGDMLEGVPQEKWVNEMADHAIFEAREKAKLYCIPAEWTATLVSGEQGSATVTFRVCRKRFRKSKLLA